MLLCKYYTKNYKHEFLFEFQGKDYFVYSMVRLTEEGRQYLGSRNRDVILTEQFINWDGKRCWKYEFQSLSLTEGIVNYATDKTPDELIEKVITPANSGYVEREIFGIQANSYTNGEKHTKKDWEIPEVLIGWIILVVIFIVVALFKDWYIRFIIRIAAAWMFGLYRQAHVKAHTTYVHNEDTKMLKKKYEILYGIAGNKEDTSNE